MASYNKRNALFCTAAALVAALPSFSAPAKAQEKGASKMPLETIVVTARRRDEGLLEVPVSVTALTAEDLRSANAFGLEDLAQLTPGLNFSALPGGFAEPTIRGLTQTDQLGLIGNVGVFIDGIFLNNRASIEFGNMDLEQIEVLKGPQSALFGRDTFAGAINYRTRGPVIGEFDGMLEAQLGSDELYSVRGSFNIPMGDSFAARIFGGTSSFDGTIPNEREGASDNLGGWEERSTFGAQVLFDNGGPLRVRAMYLQNRQEEDNPATRALRFTENTGGTVYVVDDGAGGTFNVGSLPGGDLPNLDRVSIDPRGAGLEGDLEMAYAIVEYDFDFATLSATVSTSESNYSSFFDNFGDEANYTRPFFPLTPDLSNYFFTNQTGDAAEQDSYELRLASNGDAGLDWQVGIVRFDASTGGVLSTTTPLISDINTLETITRVEERIVQEIDAVFGAVNVPVTSKLNIGAELRYTWEDQALTDEADIFFFPVVSRPFSSIDAKFDYWSGRISADYLLNDSTMIYGSLSRGVKTGGINAAQQGTEFATYDEETNLSYELGVKTQMLDGRLTLVGALFYIDWEDLQSTAPGDIGIGPSVVNGIGSPSSTGIELDATFDVTDQFRLRVATTFLDPTYGDDFTDQAIEGFCPENPSVPTVQRCSATSSGNRIARTPEFSFFASGTYTWSDVVWGLDAYARADYSYEGDKYATSANSASITEIELVNLRAGLRNDSLEVALWMDNALDEALLARGTPFTDPSDGTVCAACGALASTRLTAGNGRTFGATVTKRF
jgi:iron complex outermembrane receptor protein